MQLYVGRCAIYTWLLWWNASYLCGCTIYYEVSAQTPNAVGWLFLSLVYCCNHKLWGAFLHLMNIQYQQLNVDLGSRDLRSKKKTPLPPPNLNSSYWRVLKEEAGLVTCFHLHLQALPPGRSFFSCHCYKWTADSLCKYLSGRLQVVSHGLADKNPGFSPMITNDICVICKHWYDWYLLYVTAASRQLAVLHHNKIFL